MDFLQIRVKIHIHLVGLQNGRFPSGLSTKILYSISLPTVSEHVISINYNTDSNAIPPVRLFRSVNTSAKQYLHFHKHNEALPCSCVRARVYGTA